MVRRTEKVGENRYRESYGRYYEDFTVGDIYEHRPKRTVTEFDNVLYTLLTMNNHPIHFDAEYGEETEFGQNLVNSGLTTGIIGGMTVSDISYKAVANLGWEEIELTNPVFVGDTLRAESEVVQKRESNSRPDDGIVTVKTRGFKQTDEKVTEFKRSILVPKQDTDDE